MDIVAGGFKKGGRPSGERDRLQPTKQQGGTDQGPEEQGSRPVKRCVMPLREFQPRAYEDDSDDDHDPYAALNARRLQEAKDGQKRAEVVRKAGKASRPGRLAQGVHYINPVRLSFSISLSRCPDPNLPLLQAKNKDRCSDPGAHCRSLCALFGIPIFVQLRAGPLYLFLYLILPYLEVRRILARVSFSNVEHGFSEL